jgi:hypothetical protein
MQSCHVDPTCRNDWVWTVLSYTILTCSCHIKFFQSSTIGNCYFLQRFCALLYVYRTGYSKLITVCRLSKVIINRIWIFLPGGVGILASPSAIYSVLKNTLRDTWYQGYPTGVYKSNNRPWDKSVSDVVDWNQDWPILVCNPRQRQ